MTTDGVLQLLHARLKLIDILLRYKSQLDFLEVLLAELELTEKILDLLSLFLQFLGVVDVFIFDLGELFLGLLQTHLHIRVAHLVGHLGLLRHGSA